MYYFTKFRYGAKILIRDEQPLALYCGSRRIGPQPKIVWWFLPNIVILVLVVIIRSIELIYLRTRGL